MFLVDFVKKWFSVEFGNVVETFEAFVVSFVDEVELWGFDQKQ